MECTGVPSVIRDVLGATAPAGIVCLLGVTEPGHKRELDIGELNRTLVLDNDVGLRRGQCQSPALRDGGGRAGARGQGLALAA